MRTLEAISRHAGFGSVSERGEFTSSILEIPFALLQWRQILPSKGSRVKPSPYTYMTDKMLWGYKIEF